MVSVDQRNAVETVVLHDPAERIMTDIAFAEAMMTVNAAAKGAFRIVEGASRADT